MNYTLHLTTVDTETYSLLQKISALEVIASKFALAGGTSLALQIGHRRSIDLDFFSPFEFNTRELEIILSTDTSINFQFVNSNSRMLFCYINNIKCDFICEPARLIRPFVFYDSVPYFTVEDIAAMKLHTICGRGKKKDFFDIYALLEIYDWKDLITLFTKKYNEDQLFFLWRSIIYFEDADGDPDIQGIKPYDKNWDEIKKYIRAKCSI
ncbi:MAG: nucleotidyl transferase AbiEii/AbiGii toxin family protein [Bacteroidota bacterium]